MAAPNLTIDPRAGRDFARTQVSRPKRTTSRPVFWISGRAGTRLNWADGRALILSPCMDRAAASIRTVTWVATSRARWTASVWRNRLRRGIRRQTAELVAIAYG